ncbi:hypothetical protein O6H91_11G059500 [Diphasiastrum complanatum]|uniref:Uncharacterized protein n=2 Tax=Diphasiastrum complanatum TaxID=34168 RepID=A0ACC2C9T8_DIPCM|nr:hypothetical protein O6H91_11G059500 [Diphasiastrum complanatum]KAJ7538690.1 hypothetical protein O6H91_11G059500 [Diphasiastrum complanatum]
MERAFGIALVRVDDESHHDTEPKNLIKVFLGSCYLHSIEGFVEPHSISLLVRRHICLRKAGRSYFPATSGSHKKIFIVTDLKGFTGTCGRSNSRPIDGFTSWRCRNRNLRRGKMPSPVEAESDRDTLLGRKESQSPLSRIFRALSAIFKADELGIQIAVIALPAILALAADPLASLVDTAFIGQIGPVELAAVGVSISVFNLVSKVLNIPLLNITTSFVAEDNAADEVALKEVPLENTMQLSLDGEDEASTLLIPSEGDEVREGKSSISILPVAGFEKRLLPAVSSALVLGSALGLAEAAVLAFGAGPILTVMGLGSTSSMRLPAIQYLCVRAIGAPAVVVALAVQGVFRGFKDTKTPLYATVAGNIANIVLDPILMFGVGYGVTGAAVATVISQYLIVLLLLWRLNELVILLPPKIADLRFDRYLKSGGLLLGRTAAILLTMTLSTSMAARQGTIPMAAHQICMQIWLAASLLSDSLALAGQAIIADGLAREEFSLAKQATIRVLQIGVGFGIVMAIILALVGDTFTKLFTKDAGVLAMIPSIIPFIAATQPINSLAFVFDGVFYGASDFGYSAYSMIVIAIISSVCLLWLPSLLGLPGVWIGLSLLMILRMSAGLIRLGTASGPWFFLKEGFEETRSRT